MGQQFLDRPQPPRPSRRASAAAVMILAVPLPCQSCGLLRRWRAPGPGGHCMPPGGASSRRIGMAFSVMFLLCHGLPNAFPQKGGGSEYGPPSRPVPRSACPQHPRTPLLLSQPSSHPLLRVVQTWVGAALLARQFLVASIRARPQPQRRVAMQKQPPANAQSTSIGFAACS